MKKIAVILGRFCTEHNPIDFNNLYDNPRGLTGSDSIFVELGKEFAKRGYETHLFCFLKPNQPVQWENCFIHDVDTKNLVITSDYWAVISLNDPRDFLGLPQGPFRLWSQQLNGFSYLPSDYQSWYDLATSPSKGHLEHHLPMIKDPEKWHVVHDAHSYTPVEYTDKVPGRIIWTSSIDRGLHWLLSIFPRIKARVPEAHLRLFYGYSGDVENLESHLTPHVAEDILEVSQRIRYLRAMLPRLKKYDVEYFGSVSYNQIQQEYKDAMVLAFTCDPTVYTEGFSISCLTAAGMGVVPIISDADALPSVYEGVCEIVPGKVKDKLQEWEDAIVKALTDPEYYKTVVERCRNFAEKHDWTNMVDQLENLIKEREV